MSIFVYEKIPKKIIAFSNNIKRTYNEGKLTWKAEDIGGYEEYGIKVDYVRGTGSQYIITDYLPNTNTDITIDFTPNAYAKMIFGQRYALAGQKDALVFYNETSTTFYAGFDSANTRITYQNINMALNTAYTLHINKDILEINGEVQNSSFFGDYSTIDPNTLLPLAIFTINQKDEVVDPRIFEGDIRSFIIKENDEIVMNLIPVQLTKQSWGDNPLNSFVLWDTITNTVPKHVGAFLGAGLEPYVKTQHTTFTGTQYINTLINNNSNLITKGRAKGVYVQGLGSERFLYGSREAYLIDTNALFINTSNGSVFCGMGSNWADRKSGSLDNLNWFDFQIDKDKSIVGGKTYANTTEVNFSESDLTIYLGAMNQRTGLDPRYFYGSISAFSIEQDGMLIADYIPCVESATGIAGFWDNVSNQFVKSDTANPLIAGPLLASDWSVPNSATIETNGDFSIEYTDELIPDWQYDNISGNVTLVYENEEDTVPIYRDNNGNIIIEEE